MYESIPTPSGYDVYWEKWVDAYAPETEVITLEEEEYPEEGEDLSFEEYPGSPQWSEKELPKFRNIKTVFTPFGMLPLTEQSLASTYFKFWVGHTNFKITPSFYKIVSNINGVESIDVFSPYRFRIGIATLFKDRDVMSQIKKKMVAHIRESKNVPSKKAHDSGSS